MNKKFLFLTLFLLLIGCSTPENDNQESSNNNQDDVSSEETESDQTEEETEENNSTADEQSDESTEETNDISSSPDDSEEDTSAKEEASDEASKNGSAEDVDSSVEDNDTDDEVEEENDTDTMAVEETGTSRFIDVLSQDFINVYFSSPDTYIPSELTIGMSQTEVESIYGKHETEYQLEGANLAIYGNVGVLYSQYFPATGDEFSAHINPDENFITDVWIYVNQPHSAILNAYGSPTLDYDDYELYGPGEREMIYDGTRGNGYAVYVAVQNDIAMVMHKAEERDLDSFPYTVENR